MKGGHKMGDSVKTQMQRSKGIKPTEETQQGRRVDLLIVDDEETLREFLASILGKEMPGIKIKLAGDGVEAYSLALKFRPRVVWTNIRMPKMDGLKLTELIK